MQEGTAFWDTPSFRLRTRSPRLQQAPAETASAAARCKPHPASSTVHLTNPYTAPVSVRPKCTTSVRLTAARRLSLTAATSRRPLTHVVSIVRCSTIAVRPHNQALVSASLMHFAYSLTTLELHHQTCICYGEGSYFSMWEGRG